MNALAVDKQARNGVFSSVTVRWSDMDAYGHINHARVVTLLEEVRIDAILQPGSELAGLVSGAVVVSLQVNYHRQLRHADSPLEVQMWVSRLRAADFILCYELRPCGQDDACRPAVTASTQIGAFDVAAQRTRRLSAAEIAALKEWQRA